MIVAVAADLELPPQQSEILGQRASSQTVWRFRPRRSFLMRLKLGELGMGVLSQEGRRVISFFLPAGPTRAVLRAYASDGSSGALLPPETKSEKAGPVFSLSRNVVDGLPGVVAVGEAELDVFVPEGFGVEVVA
jgi:hypothetical protein